MAFRSLVKIAQERDKERRKTTIIRPGALGIDSLLNGPPLEQSAHTSSLDTILSLGGRKSAPPGWVDGILSKPPTQDQETPLEPIAGCVVETTLSCESAATNGTDSQDTTHYRRGMDSEPPAGLRTYKWAEKRLSKTAALAGANWDQPEALEYIRKMHRRASIGAKRKRSTVHHVARPSDSTSNVVLPPELPPSLERPQSTGTKQTEESTVDSGLQPVRCSKTDELVHTHRLQTLSQAGETTVKAAQLAPSSDDPCLDDSFAAKPMSACADASMGDTQKPPAKCNCVLM